ncbi:hypothetical protein K4K56_008201 [Colletotrichum sp. SAR 10_98]|nr:hypothetical protein K4K55_007037 [Colletotrichum sp. SAR 10_96]KAI8255023.1 hypothetical protein K4K56_008201 [Colletotrichum sp. SAR 10_98]
MASSPGGIVPAQLGFLAVFNPSLGNTDDTLDDQIVYYASSIDLTRIPLPPKLQLGKTNETPEEVVEYSSKEIKPATLLLQDLLRAHSTFLLHHGTSLSALFVRSRRPRFLSLLGRYWDLFLSTWNVLLQGNPARTIFAGINVAASGELGIGVGEEERGSGEREVLEGLVGRIDGLVDLVVSKFGSVEADGEAKDGKDPKSSWLGTGQDPGPEDGAVFLGTGALSRKSVRDVAHWMEDLYTWGENAYGVIDSTVEEAKRPGSSKDEATAQEEGDGHLDKLMTVMKLGYGTYWSIGKSDASSSAAKDELSALAAHQTGEISKNPFGKAPKPKAMDDDAGHFLIGLMGDVEDSGDSDENERGTGAEKPDAVESNSRTMLRTVHVELEKTGKDQAEAAFTKDLSSLTNEITPLGANAVTSNPQFGNQDSNKASKLRVIVYINKPFIFTFLFELRTDSLALNSFYRSLHHQLLPLRKPLLSSIQYRPERPNIGSATGSIYDLVWDAQAMTVHSSIPNIPDHTQMSNPNAQPAWSRVEAMNTHMQLLNLFNITRSEINELERTCKTNRGWWVVWSRILERPAAAESTSEVDEGQQGQQVLETDDSSPTSGSGSDTPVPKKASPAPPKVSKEIFLIRRASDHAGYRGVSSSFAEGGTGWGDGAGRLASGIGIDTRKYIEGLLNFSR